MLVLTASCGRDTEYVKRRYLDSGDKYMEKGKLREASIMYRNAVKADPRFGLGYYKQGLLQLKQNQYSGAIGSFRRAVELLPEGSDRVDARIKLADIYLAYSEGVRREKELLDDAIRVSDELLALDPRSFEGHWIRGRVATLRARELSEGNLPTDATAQVVKAIEELRTANEIKPHRAEVLIPLARSLWANDQTSEAERVLLDLIGRQPKTALAYADLIRLYKAQRRFPDVELILKKAIDQNPERHTFLIDLASYYQDFGRRSEMAPVLDRLKLLAKDAPATHESIAGFYLRSGDADSAIRHYQQVIAAGQNKTKYQRLIVEALLSRNRRAEAAQMNDEILKANPKDMDALVRRASFLFDAGDTRKAIVELEALLRLAPDHYGAHYNLGRALASDGQREPARFRFAEAVRLAPGFVPAHLALAQIELATGEFLKAIISADAAIAVDDRNTSAKVTRASGLMGLSRFDEARSELEALVATQPTASEAWFQLGVLYASRQQWPKAEAAYWKSYNTNPADLSGLMAVVNRHMRSGGTERGLQILYSETTKSPKDRNLAAAYADALAQANRTDAALAAYTGLLVRFEGDPAAAGDIHLRLGECHRKLGRPHEALKHLRKARELRPASAMVLHNLAITYESLGMRGEAKEAYESSLKIDDDNAVALNNLAAYIADNGGDLDQALTYAQRARQKLPGRPEITDTVGWVYLKKNLPDQALEIFRDLTARYPAQATFRYHLGAALAQKGDVAEASRELTLALAAKPNAVDSEKIKELLAKLSGSTTLRPARH